MERNSVTIEKGTLNTQCMYKEEPYENTTNTVATGTKTKTVNLHNIKKTETFATYIQMHFEATFFVFFGRNKAIP